MENKFQKIITIMKNNIVTILLGSVFLLMVFVPEAKASFQKGLMKAGFFQPDFEDEKKQTTINETPAYRMKVSDVKGNDIAVEKLKGKVVFINFWATWCPPCIAEMPSLQILYDKMKDKDDVVFLFVEVEGNVSKATKFMEKRKLTMPIHFVKSEVPQEFFQGNLPTTVILDKEGKIAHKTLGMADYSGQNVVDFIEGLRAQ